MEKDEGFISDGMNAFERNVKRIVDCLLAGIALIIFSPLFYFFVLFFWVSFTYTICRKNNKTNVILTIRILKKTAKNPPN